MDFLKRILAVILILISFIDPARGQEDERSVNLSENSVLLSDSFKVDLSLSKVHWKGKAMGIIKHEGTVDFTQANMQISNGRASGGIFIVDLTTITPTDKDLNPKEGPNMDKLKEHLSSPEFFDVESYPTATFVLDSLSGDQVFGMLTIRGHTLPERVENIVRTRDGENTKITGDLVINRKMHDVTWESRFQDWILSKHIKIRIILIGK